MKGVNLDLLNHNGNLPNVWASVGLSPISFLCSLMKKSRNVYLDNFEHLSLVSFFYFKSKVDASTYQLPKVDHSLFDENEKFDLAKCQREDSCNRDQRPFDMNQLQICFYSCKKRQCCWQNI